MPTCSKWKVLDLFQLGWDANPLEDHGCNVGVWDIIIDWGIIGDWDISGDWDIIDVGDIIDVWDITGICDTNGDLKRLFEGVGPAMELKLERIIELTASPLGRTVGVGGQTVPDSAVDWPLVESMELGRKRSCIQTGAWDCDT